MLGRTCTGISDMAVKKINSWKPSRPRRRSAITTGISAPDPGQRRSVDLNGGKSAGATGAATRMHTLAGIAMVAAALCLVPVTVRGGGQRNAAGDDDSRRGFDSCATSADYGCDMSVKVLTRDEAPAGEDCIKEATVLESSHVLMPLGRAIGILE